MSAPGSIQPCAPTRHFRTFDDNDDALGMVLAEHAHRCSRFARGFWDRSYRLDSPIDGLR